MAVGKLAISEIEPLDLEASAKSWEQMIRHVKKPGLRAILEVRSLIQDEITAALREQGFLHPPVHLFSTCVDPLNHDTEPARFQYYGQECSLMQSLIFHKMAVLALTDIEKVFWISPNIRKERGISDKRRYASEFTQIDFESTKLDMQSCLHLIESIVQRVFSSLSRELGPSIERISGRKLLPLQKPMARIDAVLEAKKRGVEVSQLEALLAAEISEPIFLTNLKREAYDRRDDDTGIYLNYDVVMPVYGEILSGGEREFTAERLEMRMRELEYPLSYFGPVLKLAKEHGFRPSAGAGFGIERFVRAVLLLDDIADVYPFRRVPEETLIF